MNNDRHRDRRASGKPDDRSVLGAADNRAGAEGAPDRSAGMPGCTLGTGGSFREQDV